MQFRTPFLIAIGTSRSEIEGLGLPEVSMPEPGFSDSFCAGWTFGSLFLR